jgi:hypothetical protein
METKNAQTSCLPAGRFAPKINVYYLFFYHLFSFIIVLKLRNYAYFCQPFGEEEFPLGIKHLYINTVVFLSHQETRRT